MHLTCAGAAVLPSFGLLASSTDFVASPALGDGWAASAAPVFASCSIVPSAAADSATVTTGEGAASPDIASSSDGVIIATGMDTDASDWWSGNAAETFGEGQAADGGGITAGAAEGIASKALPPATGAALASLGRADFSEAKLVDLSFWEGVEGRRGKVDLESQRTKKNIEKTVQ